MWLVGGRGLWVGVLVGRSLWAEPVGRVSPWVGLVSGSCVWGVGQVCG